MIGEKRKKGEKKEWVKLIIINTSKKTESHQMDICPKK